MLIHKLITAADLVNIIAQQHAMQLQFAAGKTEAVIQLRGRGKQAALNFLADHRPSASKHFIAALPLASGDMLRVGTCYTNLGTIEVATDCNAQDLAHRRAAAQAAEKTQAAKILCATHVPYKCKMLVVTAMHASLMYDCPTWWPLTPKQQEAFAVTYTSPSRRAVGGSWSPKNKVKPLDKREALSRASFPWPETTLRIARLRLLNRVLHCPPVLLALLQSPAGTERQQMAKLDLADLKNTLPTTSA